MGKVSLHPSLSKLSRYPLRLHLNDAEYGLRDLADDEFHGDASILGRMKSNRFHAHDFDWSPGSSSEVQGRVNSVTFDGGRPSWRTH